MRKFFHPRASDITLAGVLHALGDPIRLGLVAKLASCPQGNAMSCAAVAERLRDVPLSTRHHHLRILREAGVIFSERQGVEVRNRLRRAELEARFPGLLAMVLQHQ